MRTRTWDVVYYGALAASFLLGLATLWCVDYLPTNDGPQHIFLGHVENHYSDPTTMYGRQFVPQVQFAARGFALWWTPLEPLLGFRDATRVVLSLFYSWSFAGYALLVHALGRPRRWLALLGCGVSLSWPLYMGLFPYYAGLGIGLLILGFVARRATFDRRAVVIVGGGLVVQFVHHAFSVVPTLLFLCILVMVRSERTERRATLLRLGLSLLPAVLGLLALVVVRPASPAGPQDFHWEPLLRRALILPRVLWSGGTATRWLGNALLLAGFIASIARRRRAERTGHVNHTTRAPEGRTERAYIRCAWSAAFFLVALPIVIPGWQFFNVRFAAFFVAFTLPLIPLEKLRRPALESSLCALSAVCFAVAAFDFHRSLRASCADDLAGLSLPIKRSGFRFPLVLEPFCGLPRDATKSPVPFLGPARSLAGVYATAQGGTVPNAFASVFAIHPFKARPDEGGLHVPIPEEETLRFGEELSRLANPEARRHELQTVSIFAQSYEDLLIFGVSDGDIAMLGELGFRTAFRARTFAMMELEPCKTEVVIQDHKNASVITVGGGLGGRKEITWEHPAKPGPVTAEGEIVTGVSQRLCGPGWLRVRYQIGDSAFACSHTEDGKIYYVAKPGEVTRVRCTAPEL